MKPKRPAAHVAGARCILRAGGLRLAGKIWGPASGQRILALHGWLDNAASFDRLAPLLPEARIVAMDLAGHGLSQHRPVGLLYHFVDWVADVIAMADALGWERLTLMGHSMGAGIAALVAGAFPERVDKLVLLDGLGPLSAPAEDAPLRLARAVRERTQLPARRLRPYPDLATAAERLQKVAGHLDQTSARLLVERGMRRVRGGYVWRSDPRLRGAWPLRLTEEQIQAFLRRISAPTLLVWATNGYPFDAEQMRERAAAIGRLTLHRVEGSHHVHLDDAPRVAALVRSFLA